MGMETRDNDLLKQFMCEQKQEIPDNGFSRRVMHRLPHKENIFASMWATLCIVIGVFLFISFDVFQMIVDLVRKVFISIMQNGSIHIDWKVVLILFCLASIVCIRNAWKHSEI
jgi:hypothetical protein